MTICGAAVAAQVITPGKAIASIPMERKEWKVAELTNELFTKYVGQVFTVTSPAHVVTKLTLSAVKEHHGSLQPPPKGGPVLEMFTLVFEGPCEKTLAQDLYSFEHEKMGVCELMMVPVHSKNPSVHRYEVVFNRIVTK